MSFSRTYLPLNLKLCPFLASRHGQK